MRLVAENIPLLAFGLAGQIMPLNKPCVVASDLKAITIKVLGKKSSLSQFKE